MLSVRLLVNSRLLIVKLFESENYTLPIDYLGDSGGFRHPNPHIVQG